MIISKGIKLLSSPDITGTATSRYKVQLPNISALCSALPPLICSLFLSASSPLGKWDHPSSPSSHLNMILAISLRKVSSLGKVTRFYHKCQHFTAHGDIVTVFTLVNANEDVNLIPLNQPFFLSLKLYPLPTPMPLPAELLSLGKAQRLTHISLSQAKQFTYPPPSIAAAQLLLQENTTALGLSM